ncbi:phosphoglucomutase (alpha-D-glucose-1,6-bisphosphate-dependent) [Streptomyces sp. NPDC001889]
MLHPRAGTRPLPGDLIDPAELTDDYYALRPDPAEPSQRVAFGTNGHRGSASRTGFNEDHVAAISQAVADYRAMRSVTGPLFIGSDTHALSEPARRTAVEVFAANGVTTVVDSAARCVPTPAVSHAILAHNRDRRSGLADGVVITPSHNPPGDGGYKYNQPHGGPAAADATSWIQDRANELLAQGLAGVRRTPFERAVRGPAVATHDYLGRYVEDLASVLDLEAVRAAGVRIGADPLGGASLAYWDRIGEHYGLDLTVMNPVVDPRWPFLSLDWDGSIRMDCSSPHTMAGPVSQRDRYDVIVANDADADRHGIITPDAGLLAPNHFLAAAVWYLHAHRDQWPAGAGIGKSVVTSGIIDRIARQMNRPVMEVPVGFKWFVGGLSTGALCWGGEESAGASFLRRDGSVWTTDKDGLVPSLLAAEIIARTGSSPSENYRALTRRFGEPAYTRVDFPATAEQRASISALSPESLAADGLLAGEAVVSVLTAAPGNGVPLGGVKVSTENSWFAARPSGTEDVYKVYAESFLGPGHVAEVLKEAERTVSAAITA